MITVIDGVFTQLQMEKWKENINRSTDNFVSGVHDKEGEGWHAANSDHPNKHMCYEICRHAGKYFDLTELKQKDNYQLFYKKHFFHFHFLKKQKEHS